MASIISAGTTSGTALNMSGDTSGNLAFQTQAGANTITVPNSTGTILTTSSTGVCVAWVRFSVSGGACTIAGQYNVSSVSYLSTGQYQVNFTNAIADTNYAILVSGGESQTNYSYQSILTTSIQPVSRQDGGTFVNPSTMSVAIHR